MEATHQKRDYYEVLGVDRAATQEQIKQAYRGNLLSNGTPTALAPITESV